MLKSTSVTLKFNAGNLILTYPAVASVLPCERPYVVLQTE